MLHLRVYGPADSLTAIGGDLEARGAVRAVALARGLQDGHVLLTAEVPAESADAVLELLMSNGVTEDDIVLVRLDEIGPIRSGGTTASLIWADMLGQARRNARPVVRYLVFMVAAGIIAAFGVIQVNDILIVGAMAVSPDLLPITAACVGLVDRNFRLVYRALLTVVVGMAAACLTAGVLTGVGDLMALLPAHFAIGESALSGLTTVNASDRPGCLRGRGRGNALARDAGELYRRGGHLDHHDPRRGVSRRRGRRAREVAEALGALAVLGVDVAVLVLAGALTLTVQRLLAARRAS